MKLHEILLTNTKIQISDSSLKNITDFLNAESNFVFSITSSLSFNEAQNKFYCLKKNGQIICWLELGEKAHIHGVTYDTIKMVYALPEFRGTFAIGAFLIALKKHLSNPLILGSDKFGGVLFKDGLELVNRMNRGAHFELHLLNLQSGEKRKFEKLVNSKFETIVFEHTDFPLVHKIFNESVNIYILEGCENETI
jgi:hypothetical protein